MLKLKTLIKTTLTPIALCLTLIIAAPAMAKKDHHQKHDGMRQILTKLSLTATQKQDIRQVLKESRADQHVLSADAQSLQQELRSLVQSTDWDETTVEKTLTQLHTFRQKNELQRASNKNQIWNTLTDTQQAKFVVLMDAHIADREENGSKGKNKGIRLNKLDLSEEQLTAIEAIKSASKVSIEASKSSIMAYKQAERGLIQSTAFDADAWQTLSDKYQADFLTLAQLKAKSKYDRWNLLTSEQQLKLLSKMEEMGKKRRKKNNRQNHM
ncbi:MAG: Spy/CpxP family protein refolding chaperone [Paraglaciecola sp.]|nr:Spy/CpxP family protein refolding chaperone [Paraglaciecola sp.]